jgi:general secretion pathway protein E
MIGEIRDRETANVSAQAALTGHAVLSTLHTNDAASAITRLIDIGLEPYLVKSTLNAVLAQRLVRMLCSECRSPSEAPTELVAGDAAHEKGPFYRARGCDACANTGFRGRTVITELLVMSDELRAVVSANADARLIERAALSSGMRTMFQDGIAKVRAGVTTINEVMRVTREG